MQLHLEWSRPYPLRAAGRDENLIYNLDHSRLTDSVGLYVFGRKHGNAFEALYVGQASNIRLRVRGQLKNLPLMLHLKKAKAGKRILLLARFKPKPGQQQAKCLNIIERALIRHFLSEGHDLVNKQGARLRRHEIASTGAKKIVPDPMFVDRVKGE